MAGKSNHVQIGGNGDTNAADGGNSDTADNFGGNEVDGGKIKSCTDSRFTSRGRRFIGRTRAFGVAGVSGVACDAAAQQPPGNRILARAIRRAPAAGGDAADATDRFPPAGVSPRERTTLSTQNCTRQKNARFPPAKCPICVAS